MSSILLLSILLTHIPHIQAQWDGARYAWWKSPGTDFNSGLAIGNGRLGALAYGSALETISLNENSVWSGPWQDRANGNANGALNKVRSQLQSGDITGAGQTALTNMAGNPTSPRNYHPLADLKLDFGHTSSGISSYTRYLDTYNGNAFVTYIYSGVNYT